MRAAVEVIPEDGWALDPEPAFPCGPLSWALSPLLPPVFGSHSQAHSSSRLLSAPIVVVLTWCLTL